MKDANLRIHLRDGSPVTVRVYRQGEVVRAYIPGACDADKDTLAGVLFVNTGQFDTTLDVDMLNMYYLAGVMAELALTDDGKTMREWALL